MRTAHYKVRFVYRPVGQEHLGKAWIDGYTKASTAKAEVERVNERSERHGVTATYLGDERRASRS